VTVVSDAFMPLATGERQALGQPGLPLAVVPHPVASRPEAELVELGGGLVTDVIEALTGGSA
jgi:hypothetical protein